jgi:hypothetical protein
MSAPLVSTALTGFAAYNQYQGGQDAKQAAKRQTREDMLDERNRAAAEMAERRARLAASGVTASGSPMRFMDTAARQDKRRLKSIQRSGKARADALGTEGTTGALTSLSRIPGYWV